MDTKPTSPWFTAIVSCAILAVGVGTVLVKLHASMMEDLQAAMDAQSGEVDSLRSHLSTMEVQQAALAEKQEQLAKPDTTATDALKAELAASNATIAELTARLEALESRPATPAAPIALATPVAAPVPSPAHFAQLRAAVLSGAAFRTELLAAQTAHPDMLARPALEARAEQGVPTESALRSQLQTLLASAEAPAMPVRDRSTMGRINDYFAGYISIRKKGERDPYAALRASAANAEIPALMQLVETLPEPARAPFANWLSDAVARREALAALETLPTDAGAGQ